MKDGYARAKAEKAVFLGGGGWGGVASSAEGGQTSSGESKPLRI